LRKKRILWVNESSTKKTGYGIYGQEVLSRLHAVPEFEVAELACYVTENDIKRNPKPWRVYPNKPMEKDAAYELSPSQIFGEKTFNEVLLHFRPDIVMDIRDWWMFEFQQRSPFRDLFHWAIMPTVDAEPQNPQWINTFASADSIFTYSEFGTRVLQDQCSDIKVVATASPAANPENFVPFNSFMEKLCHKSSMGLDENCTIIGMVGRNQRRKLLPDLFDHFSKSIRSRGLTDTFLHCHTYYPDIGWNIPYLLDRFEIGNRVLFTYRCVSCKDISIDFYKDTICSCGKCGKFAKKMVGVRNPIDGKDLGRIYGMYDLYIQYANSEGFGMPQLEAAYSGVPVAAIDYSAMESVMQNIQGIKLTPLSYTMECETGCLRAIPDFEEFDSVLGAFHDSGKPVLDNHKLFNTGKDIAKKSRQSYNWDKTAQFWIDHFKGIPVKPDEKTWKSPVQIHIPEPIEKCLELPTLREQVNFIFNKVLYKPEWIGNFLWAKVMHDCTFGYRVKNAEEDYYFNESHVPSMDRYEDYSIEGAYKDLSALRNQWNQWEELRRSENARF
tara:strand:- start:1424 stop:3085 length:1662 start_codon:yes stop_codon:yes gene_type:complete